MAHATRSGGRWRTGSGAGASGAGAQEASAVGVGGGGQAPVRPLGGGGCTGGKEEREG